MKMREILFRGKCRKSGRWIYGDLLKHGENDYSIYEEGKAYSIPVREETIGQYIDLKDYDGNRILREILSKFQENQNVGLAIFMDWLSLNGIRNKKHLCYCRRTIILTISG